MREWRAFPGRPADPLGFDLERDAPVGGPVVVAVEAPPEVGGEVAAEETGEAELLPLPDVHELVPTQALVGRRLGADEDQPSERCG